MPLSAKDKEKIKQLSPEERAIMIEELKARKIKREQKDAMSRGMNLTKKRQDELAGIKRV